MSDHVRIRGLRFEAVIGVLPEEQETPQPIEVHVELSLDLRRAGRSGRIVDTVDYDRVAREIVALVQFRRYRLLEAASEETAAMLFGLHPCVRRLRLTLEKPHALAARGAVAAVDIRRERGDFPGRREATRFGEVDVLLETREAGLYLLHVEPGRVIPPHRHAIMRELEWLVAGELWQDDARVPDLSPVHWPQGHVHAYENRSLIRATLFCCDCPPFLPADEIEVGSERA